MGEGKVKKPSHVGPAETTSGQNNSTYHRIV